MADAAGELERGRGSYAKRAWTDARETLLQADLATPLGAEDLEQLATADYMLGREDEWITALERAHHAYLEAADPLQAVRCAFWVGMSQALRGDMAQASGWLGRAQRLLEREGDCVERGYLLLPLIFQREATGDFAGAAETAAQATEIGQRFGDADLFALAIHAQGQMLVQDGRLKDGLALLDEAMITVTGAEEVSPIVAGLVYCGVILACQQAYELRRAQEWTAALTRWCERQQDLVAFTGRCLTHRAEVMQAQGAWQEALEEARRAARRLEETSNLAAAGLAFYRQGELHRLQGDFAPAEEAYREASRCGWEPQPGLALLRAAQGRLDAAASSMRRVLVETDAQMKRAGLLPAFVEIMLASGSRDEAREACLELDEIARRHESGMLEAMAGQTRGALALSDGDARAALPALRRAVAGARRTV